MALLATAAELASYLQQDLDTSTATLVLTVASAEFELAADTKFEATAATYTVEGWGQCHVSLPKRPVTAVASVTVDGVAVTDYVRINAELYRTAGWGGTGVYPAAVVVSYTHGLTAVPGDAKGAVLESAAQAYVNPDLAISEQIDDYAVRRSVEVGGVGLTPSAEKVAARYRVGAVA